MLGICIICTLLVSFTMAFTGTTGGRREDLSLRLRAQNMRNAKDQTKQLEVESRKMEERLLELKVAMSREKEEREKKGGGFWGKGQQGSLGSNYTKEVLQKPLRSAEKKKKVKVLKDEPIVTPERSKGPGSLGFIAQRNTSNKENKIKGPKCGQCEAKKAQVSCLECGEDYCAGCFASFHLKGALKKHRSVPVRAGDARPITPRLPPPSNNSNSSASSNGYETRKVTIEDNPNKVTLSEIDFSFNQQTDNGDGRSSPVGSSKTFDGPSLMDGAYNEADSAASFQAALKAWRGGNGKTTQKASSSTTSPSKSQAVSVDHGTSTGDSLTQKPVEIKFKKGSLTYAEKLLLKKHRRSDLQAMETPRLTSSNDRDYVMSPESETEIEELAKYVEDENVPSVFHTTNPAEPMLTRPESQVSIIELPDGTRTIRGLEQGLSYYVSEEPGDREELQTAREEKKKSAQPKTKKAFPTPPSSAKAQRSHDNTNGSLKKGSTDVKQSNSSQKRSPAKTDSDKMTPRPPSTRRPGSKSSVKARNIRSPASDSGRGDLSLNSSPDKSPSDSAIQDKSRPKSRTKSRNQSLPSARDRKTPRPGSRAASRAQSRAASRLAIFGEGHITKSPSDALKDITSRGTEVPPVDYRGGLDDFFLGGVPLAQEERVMTPSVQKKKKDEKYKLSYNVYQMAPRSWRPYSSLGETVPSSEVVIDTSILPADQLETVQWSLSGRQLTEMIREQKAGVWPDSDEDATPRVLPIGQGTLTGRVSQAGRVSRSGRESRAIVVDGDDLHRYDDQVTKHEADEEDEEALHQLEWELASESGMITDDGKISRMSVLTPEPEDAGEKYVSEILTPRIPDQGIDIAKHLRESDLMQDFEEMEAQIREEEEVAALL